MNRIHLAGFCTFSTVNAFIFIHAVPEYGNRIKGRIKGPKRTDISAKWTINNDSKNNRNDQNSILPYIKSSHRTAHGFIQQDQRNAAFQCACRTDQFAEIRSTLTHDIYYEHGEQDNTRKITYFSFRRSLSPLKVRIFFGKGILFSRSWIRPKGHKKPQTSRPSRAPMKIRNPIT